MLGKKLRKLPQENIDWAINICALEEVLSKKIQTLSKGYAQRLSLAQAILHKPSILILDEPSSGLDPAQSITFKKLIKNLHTTTLFSSHSTSEIEEIADDVLVLNRGTLVFSGSIESLLEKTDETKLEKAYIRLLSETALEEAKGFEDEKGVGL
jgi:ABC-2 type transport system ATP-binding protein